MNLLNGIHYRQPRFTPAQDLYWFLEKRRATRLQHPPPPPELAGVAACRANPPLAGSSGCLPVCRRNWPLCEARRPLQAALLYVVA